MKLSCGSIFYQDTVMVFSPNSKRSVYMPEFQPPSINFDKEKFDIRDFLEPQWFRGREYVYLATLPRHSASQDGSLFEIFKNYNMPSEAVLDSNGYRLSSHVVDNWYKFECAAQAVIAAIYSQSNHYLTQITLLGSPSEDGGYRASYSSPGAAIRHAYLSRMWFSLYIGALYWVCMHGNTVKLVKNSKVADTPVTSSTMPSAILSEGTTDAEARCWLPLWFLCALSTEMHLQPFLSML